MESNPDISKHSGKQLPKYGALVFDANLNCIGEIADIFGPKTRFFISIKPKRPEILASFSSRINESLYTSPETDKKMQGRGSKGQNKKGFKNREKKNQESIGLKEKNGDSNSKYISIHPKQYEIKNNTPRKKENT